MKKISLFMVIMLIALMVFVGCDNNKVKERKATSEDVVIVLSYYYATSNAINNNLSGVTQINYTDYSFNNVTVTNNSGYTVVLNGKASVELKNGISTANLTLSNGSSVNNVGHTLNMTIKMVMTDNNQDMPEIKSSEIVLDGYKLTGIESAIKSFYEQHN